MCIYTGSIQIFAGAPRDEKKVFYDACDDEKSSKQNDTQSAIAQHQDNEKRQRHKKKSETISCYCKEGNRRVVRVVSFTSWKYQKRQTQAEWLRIGCERGRGEVKYKHMQQATRLSCDFSPSLHCVSFVRLRTICGKRKFFCFYFSYFFFFSVVVFFSLRSQFNF